MNTLDELEDWDYELASIINALKDLDTGRWEWELIHCCLTGKDADLDTCGQQGLYVESVNEDGVKLIGHTYKTVVGHDVCLKDESDEAFEAYMELAQALVQGCGYPGEWTGDDWFLYMEEPFEVPWVTTADNYVDFKATAESILEKFEEIVKPWDEEMKLMEQLFQEALND